MQAQVPRAGNKIILPSLLGALSKLLSVSLAFVVILVLARSMDPHAFGVYSVGVALASIAWPVATVGQPVLVLRFWPVLAERYGTESANHVLRRGLVLVGLGAAIVCTAFAIAALFADNQGQLIWAGVLAALLGLSQFACFALRATSDLAWSLVPRDVVWRLGVIAGALTLGDLTGAGALALSGGVLAVVTIAQVARLWSGFRSGAVHPVPEHDVKDMSSAQWGLWGSSIAGQALQHAGTVVVAVFLGPVEAGAFYAAHRLASLLSLALVGSNLVTGPMIARDWHAGRHAQVQDLVRHVVMLTTAAAGAGLIVYVAIGAWMLALFDPSYVSAFGALIALSCAQVVNAACGPNGHLLNLAGEERRALAVTVVSGVVNLGLVALGATFSGLTGAAVGAALAVVTWNLWNSWICADRLGIHVLHWGRA